MEPANKRGIGGVIHRVRVILVRHVVNHSRLVQHSNHLGGGGNGNPEYRFRQTAVAGEPSNLRTDSTPVDGACSGAAEERQARGRDDRDTFFGLAREFGITAELALDTREQILVGQPRQAHRARINEDHLVPRAGKLAHQVGFGVRVVIPPVFTAKADYRTIKQHAENVRQFTLGS